MNFKLAFTAGQKGINQGLPMGDGLKNIDAAIHGIQRGRTFAVGAGPKVGKSTLVDYGFVISPCMFVLEHNAKINLQLQTIQDNLSNELDADKRSILNSQYSALQLKLIEYEIIYLSYEIDRISKEFDFVSHFLERDYGISTIALPVGKLHRNSSTIEISSSYLKGELEYDRKSESEEKEIIRVSDELFEKIKEIYVNRIIPLFGEFNDKGIQVKKGMIIFLEHKTNPTGIRNYLLDYAKKNGKFLTSKSKGQDGKEYEVTIGYEAKNPRKYVVVITDHVRKILPERGFTKKDTIDKYSEYSVELKNWCKFTFVHIVHLNRSMSDTSRRQFDDDRIFATSDDFKDSGNLSEDCDYIFTMFNPNDDKYNLKKHFGEIIRRPDNSVLYPNMRTIHLVESRHCPAPQHFRVNMLGHIKKFTSFNINK